MKKSKTKIKLKFPYTEDFKAGYLNINKEPRRVVTLIGKKGGRSSTAYARYLVSVDLGRYLGQDEQVDHIDDDAMNDVLSNLQILSVQENMVKRNKNLGIVRSFITLKCPICKIEFTKESRNLKHKISNGKTPTCSRSCGGKWGHLNR